MAILHTQPRAVLLLGPTGAGKTPLGGYLEEKGFDGRRCLHFDFGQELRTLAAHALPPEGLSEGEHSFIRDVLHKGLLLEKEHFPIAKKIIGFFLDRKRFAAPDILILNGLPRHVGQARDMDAVVMVESLFVLECDADDTYLRICSNVGGDRSCRTDDGIAMIRKKLEIYKSRTAPLVDYYSEKGCAIFKMKVAPNSRTEDLYADLLSVQRSL